MSTILDVLRGDKDHPLAREAAQLADRLESNLVELNKSLKGKDVAIYSTGAQFQEERVIIGGRVRLITPTRWTLEASTPFGLVDLPASAPGEGPAHYIAEALMHGLDGLGPEFYEWMTSEPEFEPYFSTVTTVQHDLISAMHLFAEGKRACTLIMKDPYVPNVDA